MTNYTENHPPIPTAGEAQEAAGSGSGHRLVRRWAFDVAIVLTETTPRTDWKEMAVYDSRETAEKMIRLNPGIVSRVREITTPNGAAEVPREDMEI